MRDAFFKVMATIEVRVQKLLTLDLTMMPSEQRRTALSDLTHG